MADKALNPHMDPIYQELFKFGPKKADLVRSQIVEAAIDILGKEGIASLTFDLLGQRLNLKRGSIKYYFPDKDSIVEYAAKFITSKAQSITIECIDLATTPIDRVLAVSEGAFEWAERYPKHVPIFIYFWYDSITSKGGKKLLRDIRQTGCQRIAALLNEVFPSDLDHRLVLANNIQNLVTGAIMERETLESKPLKPTCREHTKLAIKQLIQTQITMH